MRRKQRLHAGGAEHRVVDVVEVGRLEVAVALFPGLLVAVIEDHELELGAGRGDPAALGEPRELAPQDLAWRGHHIGAVLPAEIGHQQDGAVVPRDPAQGVHVWRHHEVAVAALPARHRVAVHGVHVDVDREQVVAALGAVLRHLVQEVLHGEPLALEAALHVGDDKENCVDRAAVGGLAQLLERDSAVLARHRP